MPSLSSLITLPSVVRFRATGSIELDMANLIKVCCTEPVDSVLFGISETGALVVIVGLASTVVLADNLPPLRTTPTDTVLQLLSALTEGDQPIAPVNSLFALSGIAPDTQELSPEDSYRFLVKRGFISVEDHGFPHFNKPTV